MPTNKPRAIRYGVLTCRIDSPPKKPS
jgi:hypothetical protein